MQAYGKFRPTAFDSAGAFLDDRQHWLMAPVSRTRDSGPLDQSNFEQGLGALGGESETVEVHRFGHWGPGWFEVILIDPTDAERVAIGEDLERALANYPVLNEEDFSRREWEDYTQGWESYGRRDFLRKLRDEFALSDAAYDLLDDCDSDELREFFQDGVHSGEFYIGESDGVAVNLRSFDCSRQELAAFIRGLRAQARA